MSVTININKQRIFGRVDKAWAKTLPDITREIRDDANEYVKVQNRALYASALEHSELDQGIIRWQTPYAKRQYWEIETAYTEQNPRATWKWFHVAKQRHLDRWLEQVQRYMRRHMNEQ